MMRGIDPRRGPRIPVPARQVLIFMRRRRTGWRLERPTRSRILHGLLALSLQAGDSHGDEQQGRGEKKEDADRLGDEDCCVSARDQHRAPQILLHQWPKHERQHEGRWLTSQLQGDVAECCEEDHDEYVGHAVADGEHADRAEHDDGGKQYPVRNSKKVGPNPDQREVQNDQHDVTDPHARHDAPEQSRAVGHDARPRRDALDHERADHERHRGI